MIAFHVSLYEVGIVFDHLKIRVAKQIFQSHHLTTVSQIFGCERVAKSVRMDVLDASAIAEAADKTPQCVARH